MSPTRVDIRDLLAWSYVVPVGSVWAIASFFPAIGSFEPEAGTVAALGELFFLVTGLLGIAGLAAGVRLLVPPERRHELPNPLKGKPVSIALYTTLWLAGYAWFQSVV